MQYITTDNSLRRRWARVNEFFQCTQQENFWSDINQHVRRLIKGIIEVSLDEEMIQYTQTQPYQTSGDNRLDYRNGHYCRNLYTTFGPVEQITVPRSRKGLFRPSVLSVINDAKKPSTMLSATSSCAAYLPGTSQKH